jgi:hypothetical protein
LGCTQAVADAVGPKLAELDLRLKKNKAVSIPGFEKSMTYYVRPKSRQNGVVFERKRLTTSDGSRVLTIINGLRYYLPAMKHQQVEYKKVQREACGPIILQGIEGGPAVLIEKCGASHFSINGERMIMCSCTVDCYGKHCEVKRQLHITH